MSHYFLGVDGGRSSTVALVGDERGRIVGTGASGGCHRRDSLGRSVESACSEAGIDAAAVRFEAACLGFSGGAASQQALAERVVRARKLVVTDDATIALQGAVGGEPGIVTIAGTGSICLGRNAEGQRARAGGWGHVFGDEGGALDIVRQAVRAALRYEEGWGPATRLHGELIDATGARSANEMLHRFYARGDVRKRISRHAALVNHVAAEGDEIALGLLDNAAQQLATLTGAVRRQLFGSKEKARVAYVGGVFGSAIVLERFRMLVEIAGDTTVGAPRLNPAEGALSAAYQTAGLSLSPPRD